MSHNKFTRPFRVLILLIAMVAVSMGCSDTPDDRPVTDVFGGGEKFGTYTFVAQPRIQAVDRLDLGDGDPGELLTARVEVRNVGREALKISEWEISPQFELGFPGDRAVEELPIGEAVYVTISHRVRLDEAALGSLRIRSNDPDRPTHEIELSANVTFPCFEIVQESIDFGVVDPGDSRSDRIQMRNCSDDATAIIHDQVVDGDVSQIRVQRAPAAFRIAPGETFELDVQFSPPEPGPYEVTVVFMTNDDMNPEQKVSIKGYGREPDCPVAIIEARHPDHGVGIANPNGSYDALPLDRVTLDASMSYDPETGGPVTFEWTMISRPMDSNSVLELGDNGPLNEIWLDLSGDYVVELQVIGEDGLIGCQPARMTLHAVSDEDIHLQLVYDTPNDPFQEDAVGADVDLHFLHGNAMGSWNSQPWDCYWQNMEPDWGAPRQTQANGVATGYNDDPSLDRDDVDGLGPENINLDNPENNMSYAVGVHYFSDHGYGSSYATLRVYIGGVLKAEFPRKRLTDQQFWYAADVAWPTGNVTQVDTISF